MQPRPEDVTKIRRAVSVYKVSSIITGTFLLLLCLMMVLRYGFGVDIEFAGALLDDLRVAQQDWSTDEVVEDGALRERHSILGRQFGPRRKRRAAGQQQTCGDGDES